MRFDVVIGNPPYNNSIDYKFIQLATKISKELVSFIHPARWKVADSIEAEQIRKTFIEEKHLSNIVIYEGGHSGVTSVWPETYIGSVNYWLYNVNKSFDNLETFIEMSNRNIKYSECIKRKHCEEWCNYFIMNNIVLGIIEKTIKHIDFKSIQDRFSWTLDSKVYIANSLQAIYTEENKTADSRLINIKENELNYYAIYVKTQFWRAITRQFMSGFHSYNLDALRYVSDLNINEVSSIKTVEEMEKYLEKKYSLSDLEIEYLRNYGITDSP